VPFEVQNVFAVAEQYELYNAFACAVVVVPSYPKQLIEVGPPSTIW